MQKITRILVPTDFSPAANASYEYAESLRAIIGARLIVVHIIAPIHYLEDADQTLAMREAREATQRAFAALKPAPSHALIRYGIPHQVIVETAAALSVNLVIMGTHGRSGLQRLLLGSVAANVLRHAPCPVLTVRGQ